MTLPASISPRLTKDGLADLAAHELVSAGPQAAALMNPIVIGLIATAIRQTIAEQDAHDA